MPDTLLGGIVINEILVDPNGANNFDTDGNGTAAATDEFVELYNTSGAAIDISGLELWDAGVGNWFTFPPGTILQAGGHAMVMAGLQSGGSLPTGAPGDLFFEAGRGSSLINNGGDNVTLYDPAADQFIQARFNGDPLDDPTNGAGGYSLFSGTATRSGAGENFGSDTDGQSLQRQGDGSNSFSSDTPTPGTTNVCFADGARLLTPTGERPVEDIRPGDELITADNGARPVRWTYRKTWQPEDIARHDNLAPVRIRRGALGGGLPNRDLRLSQQHRVLVSGRIVARMFGEEEILLPAKALLVMEGVDLELPSEPVTYFHIMLDRHEVLFSDGLATESLYLGPFALSTLPPEAVMELRVLLGLSISGEGQMLPPPVPARAFARGQRAKQLVRRCARRQSPIGCLIAQACA